MNIDNRIIKIGAVCAALGASWAFGGDVLNYFLKDYAKAEALKSESVVRKGNDMILDERTVDIGLAFYTSRLRELLANPPKTEDLIVRQQYEEIVQDKRRELEAYEKKWLKIREAK